jgi:hypothetical protein
MRVMSTKQGCPYAIQVAGEPLFCQCVREKQTNE